jgi:hypothetical protein
MKERMDKVNKWDIDGRNEALRRVVLVTHLGQCT